MEDIQVRSVNDTRIGRLLPKCSADISLEASLIVAQFYEMFYQGNAEYGIPSINKLSKMSARRRKDAHADGKHMTLGIDLTMSFSRRMTPQDELDPNCFSDLTDEHCRSLGNWFLPLVEQCDLYTLMFFPLKDPMRVTWMVSCDHSGAMDFQDQIERILKFLNRVDQAEFLNDWTARWMAYDFWSDKQEEAYEFARTSKGAWIIPYQNNSEKATK